MYEGMYQTSVTAGIQKIYVQSLNLIFIIIIIIIIIINNDIIVIILYLFHFYLFVYVFIFYFCIYVTAITWQRDLKKADVKHKI